MIELELPKGIELEPMELPEVEEVLLVDVSTSTLLDVKLEKPVPEEELDDVTEDEELIVLDTEMLDVDVFPVPSNAVLVKSVKPLGPPQYSRELPPQIILHRPSVAV